MAIWSHDLCLIYVVVICTVVIIYNQLLMILIMVTGAMVKLILNLIDNSVGFQEEAGKRADVNGTTL